MAGTKQLKAMRMPLKYSMWDDARANHCSEAGFGTVLRVRDGIARGTGAVVTLATEKENMVIIKEKAAALYSFNKGTSRQKVSIPAR